MQQWKKWTEMASTTKAQTQSPQHTAHHQRYPHPEYTTFVHHNIISPYFVYLCKNSPVSFKYLRQLKRASHLVDYISVHIQFDLERYLLIMSLLKTALAFSELRSAISSTSFNDLISIDPQLKFLPSVHMSLSKQLFYF